MGEYLCEEDMNTGEYISRDLALRQLNATCLATDCDNYNGVRCRACTYADAMDFIDAIPAADVRPVNRWISVDKALPDNGQMVLIYFDNQFRIAKYNSNFADTMPWSSSGHWWGKELIHFWLPLPEPPKDGDIE